MAVCLQEISGKLYRWNVPPGHTPEGSKKFFFWTEFGKHISDENLDGEWIIQKQKSKLYTYKCEYVKLGIRNM